ncbi:MAG TPA: efflux RND transporter periplasmic adaptor subunit [Candidatus Paceibacterota bacterium]|nr:efflux RND transporter periplasmic adaptor subunit [Candidatus Paceibacterota bacterium]
MKTFLIKYKTILAVAGVVIVVGGTYWYVASSRPPVFGSVTAQKGNVTASLDEQGTVLAENSVNLSFQTGGQIASLAVQEGDHVGAGTVLASLDTSALNAAVTQANAGIAAAQAQLDSLQSGTRPEQLAIDQTAVENASAAIGAAIGSAYTAADDAIHNQTDVLFSTPNGTPLFLIATINSQSAINIQSQRVAIGTSLAGWYGAMNAATSSETELATLGLTTLNQIASYLNAIALAVNEALPNGTISSSQLTTFKTAVAAARTEVNASVSSLTGAQSALANAQGALALAQAGATAEQIAAQKALVLQAQAAAQNAQVALQHAELIAPFDGTVENLTAKISQVVTPGVPVAAVVNNSGLKVQTFVSEGDVAKIKAGDSANVTLDAFGTGTVFPATITTIASLETQVNGVPAYEVTLHFVNPQPSIKDGMTGNIHIVTGEHDNVVEVPTRLVINDGNAKFALVRHGGETVKQEVQVGLTGDNGMTEITSGVNEGDTLTNF